MAAAGAAREIGERGVHGHFHRGVAAWAADFQVAAPGVGISLRMSVAFLVDRPRGLLSRRGDEAQHAELLGQLRHQFRIGGDESVVRKRLTFGAAVQAIVDYLADACRRAVAIYGVRRLGHWHPPLRAIRDLIRIVPILCPRSGVVQALQGGSTASGQRFCPKKTGRACRPAIRRLYPWVEVNPVLKHPLRRPAMFATKLSYGFVVLILLSSTTALAQHSHDGYGVPSEEFYKPVSPLPPDLHFTYHHASTAAEGWLRGRAALLHAQGNYMLAASQAMICHEQARWLALDNRQRWLEHRFWLKAWHEADLQRRIEARRAQLAARRLSTFGVFMLRPDEINRATGQIAWPMILMSPVFHGPREQLNTLFVLRTQYPAPAAEAEIDRSVQHLIRGLQRHVAHVDRGEYLAAQDFLRGLLYENELGA